MSPETTTHASAVWSPDQYLRFADERTRAARDLLAAVPLHTAHRVADLGCGPGNSTELLAYRFADAEIVGVDSSAEMLASARARLPALRFVQADLADWMPEPGTDLLFANAVFQWLPDHPAVLVRLLGALPKGGVLAVQMPDNLDQPSHAAMREVASSGAWAAKLAGAERVPLASAGAYYDLLRPLGARVDIWRTTYMHVLADAAAVVEWVKGTGLRPFLDPLADGERADFLARYTSAVGAAYPQQGDGSVLLPFPRLFIVATR